MSGDSKTPREVPAVKAPASEWWIFRVVARPKEGVTQEQALTRWGGETDDAVRERWFLPEDNREPNAREWRELTHLVETGALVKLPHGQIGEPIEAYDDEATARVWFTRMKLLMPGREYVLILTTDDVPGGAT